MMKKKEQLRAVAKRDVLVTHICTFMPSTSLLATALSCSFFFIIFLILVGFSISCTLSAFRALASRRLAFSSRRAAFSLASRIRSSLGLCANCLALSLSCLSLTLCCRLCFRPLLLTVELNRSLSLFQNRPDLHFL